MRRARVSRELEGPLDRAVRTLFPGPATGVGQSSGEPTSWGAARAWIAAGKVRVDGHLVTDATARVRAGVEVSLHEAARRPRDAELSESAVVYVDPHLVVVAKPPGTSTVPYDPSETHTLDALVRAWLGRHASGARRKRGGRVVRPNLGVVQRLDKDTSGLVVFTRTWLAKQSLTQQFRQHTVVRRYLAIVHGRALSRTFRSFLVQDRGDGLRGSLRGKSGGFEHVAPRGLPPGAREAVTHVESLESLAGATLLSCRLETGRTHQIRIHLSEAGHPLLGERVYVRRFEGDPIEAPRLMLHATELGFVHPATGREVHWELPMPDDMRAVLLRLRG